MKARWCLASALIFLLAVAVPKTAGANSQVRLHFNDATRQVTLTIPTPACVRDGTGTACTWALFVDEPFVPGQPVVGTRTGTSGVLSVSYPAQFCGVIQADALVASPLHKEVGYRHLIGTCSCPSSTNQISLTSYDKSRPTTGGTGRDELVLGLGLLALAAAIAKRKTTIVTRGAAGKLLGRRSKPKA